MNPLTFNRVDFSGGLNLAIDRAKLPENQYPLALNARTRFNSVEPIHKHVEQDIPGEGTVQAIFAAREYVVVVKGGEVFYRDLTAAGAVYNQIEGIALDPDAPTVWGELIPASSRNYQRNANADKSAGVTLSLEVTGTPSALILADGISQPVIVLSNGTGRTTKSWAEWTPDDPEYVPVCGMMTFTGGILYALSPDGTQIFRSVTGQPLNFMVVVTQDGNKIDGQTAESVSYSVEFNSVAAMLKLPTQDGSIYVGTTKNSYLVTPNFESTLFGEPTFDNTFLFPTAALNPFSIVDVLGDTTFVDLTGMRSFNAVLQTKNEGKNLPFSQIVHTVFEGITQDYTAAITFDNYAMFAVKTVYGYGILVFDTLLKTYVSLDMYDGVAAIKQFAEAKVNNQRRLFFITADDKVYEAYADSDNYEQCRIYLGDFSAGVANTEHKFIRANFSFIAVAQSGTIYAQSYSDGEAGDALFRTLNNDPAYNQDYPRAIPFGASADSVRTLGVDLGRSKTGLNLGLYLSWNFAAKLSGLYVATEPKITDGGFSDRFSSRVNIDANQPQLTAVTPNVVVAGKQVLIKGVNLNNVTKLYVGENQISSFTKSPTGLTFVVPAGIAAGNYDIIAGNAYSLDVLTLAITIT